MAHQPKTELAREMILRALDAGIPAVGSPAMRCMERAIACAPVWRSGINPCPAVSGKTYFWQGGVQHAVQDVLAALATDPPTAWARLSAGAGSQTP